MRRHELPCSTTSTQMPKCSLINKLLQLKISACIVYLLCIIAIIQFFTSCGTYNYSHTSLEDIDHELFKEISSKLVLKKSKPDCKYDDILESTKTLNSWEVPKKFDDFSVKGLVNGSYCPEHCNPLFSVALLVTYRNRQNQLDVFLPYMHNFLRKQNLHYKIFLIEQKDEKPWNKGLLYNIGAKIAIAEKFPCLILHDVDLLPLDESNLYACMKQPRHLSASIDKFRYILTYDWLVGGVLAIKSEQYTAINGFSNRFIGWGGEDDDFYERIAENNLLINRFPRWMSRYTMLMHPAEAPNGARLRIMAENRAARARARGDGLSSAVQRALSVRPHRLFTIVGVGL